MAEKQEESSISKLGVPFRYLTNFYDNSTIRSRLAFQFTLIFAVILSLVFFTVFELTQFSRNIAFKSELKDRAVTAAEAYLSGDNLSEELFREIQKKYEVRLAGEIIRIYNNRNQLVFIKDSARYWPDLYIEQVRLKKELYFKVNERDCYGIYYHDNQGDYVIISSAIDVGSTRRLTSLIWVLVFTYFLTLAMVYYSGQLFAKNALKPILNVIKQVQGISASNLHMRVTEGNRKDEISELAVTFNNLLVRLENSFEMQQSFVANASHELRTPITALIGEIEVTLNRSRTGHEYEQSLDRLLMQAERLKEITNSLLDLAYAGSNITGKEEIRVDELIWELKKHFDDKNHAPIIDVQMKNLPDEPEMLVIPGNKQLLFIGIGNILSNAIKFSNGEKVQCTLGLKGNKMVIKIEDKGIGIEKEVLERVFQPFFRADNARQFSGQGIGLSLSEKIIKLHQGSINIDSKVHKGTVFTIIF